MPGFHYRDDALQVYAVFEEYVQATVYGAYASDAAVAGDPAVQMLRAELVDPLRGAVPGMPELRTRQALVDYIASLLFKCTAQHSAVNFGQFDFCKTV